jgi:hypothetical protein
MKKDQADKSLQEMEKAEEFVRKALAAISRKPVSESTIKAVARKVSKTMAGVVEDA